MPGGAAWLEQIERVPEAERHLVVHQRHCVGLNAADEGGLGGRRQRPPEGGHRQRDRDEVRERLATLAEQGATELVYQPAGPDIRRELETFMQAAGAGARMKVSLQLIPEQPAEELVAAGGGCGRARLLRLLQRRRDLHKDAWLVFVAVAGGTERFVSARASPLFYLRHPTYVAQLAATLDD